MDVDILQDICLQKSGAYFIVLQLEKISRKDEYTSKLHYNINYASKMQLACSAWHSAVKP